MSADQGSDHAPAVDVADENDGDIGGFREAHVGDIRYPEVDLRRTARPLDDDQVRARAENLETLQDLGQKGWFQIVVIPGLRGARDLAPNNDLGAGVGLRFQKDRVHVNMRLHAAGTGLEGLGASDFAHLAVWSSRHGGIVRHVLRLERPNLEAPVVKSAAKSGGQQGFSDIGAGTLEHDRRRSSHEAPARRASSARRRSGDGLANPAVEDFHRRKQGIVESGVEVAPTHQGGALQRHARVDPDHGVRIGDHVDAEVRRGGPLESGPRQTHGHARVGAKFALVFHKAFERPVVHHEHDDFRILNADLKTEGSGGQGIKGGRPETAVRAAP